MGGGDNPIYSFAIFFQKLHENEQNYPFTEPLHFNQHSSEIKTVQKWMTILTNYLIF